MKKLIVIIFLLNVLIGFSQTLIDSLLIIQPNRNLPFSISNDQRKSSRFDPPSRISNSLENRLVEINKKCFASKCAKKLTTGLYALGKIKSASNIYLMLFAFDLPPMCGEKIILVSFNSQAKVIDTITLFGRGYLINPTDKLKWGRTYNIEGKIMENLDIEIFYEENDGRANDNEIINEKILKKIYKIKEDGTFMKVNEEIIK